MRKIVKRTFSILMLLLPLTGVGIKAQVQSGNVYNFVNVEKGESMSAPSLDVVSVAKTDLKDYSQLWYAEAVDGGKFTLRNLSNGLYLNSTGSGPWGLVIHPNGNNCALSSEGNTNPVKIKNTQGNQYMHLDTNQGKVVSWWDGSAKKSQWNISSVSISAEELEANWKAVEELSQASANLKTYEAALKALFVDQACTVLKNPGADFSKDENFKKLSGTLQKMVLKIQQSNWTEPNAVKGKPQWDSKYAEKFRVQMYEPYCDPAEAAKALKINAHSNLNNPTGLYANSQQVVYLMVEGKIQEGASLYLSSVVGHSLPNGNFRIGTELKEGLNIVPFWADGNALHINYVVETFKDGKMTQHKLSQYPNLKIHIEGGHINGMFNAVGDVDAQGKVFRAPDTNEDWQYYEDRANLEDVILLGKYQTIQFYLNDTNGSHGLRHYFPQTDVNKIIAQWDRIMFVERLTLGLLSKEDVAQANKDYPTLDNPARGIYSFIGGEENGFYKDYSDAYRLHGLSFGTTSGYMYGGWDHSGYNVSTFGDIIGESMITQAGPTWGPAHEIGHQHQQVLNMRGLTEVSNNIFSNVAVWYKGLATSRVNGSEGCLMSVLGAFNQENSDFFTNNIWAQTQMYYKLWMYYHLTGHNNKFFPRLFELLRQDPMQIEENQSGTTSLLHFYKKCCLASGEDLTEFFKAYGFFSAMKDRYVEDYSSAVYNMDQKEIDAAIAEVKAMNLPVNNVAILINDGTNDKTYSHDGKTERSLWDGRASSEVGNYIGFYPTKENKMTIPFVCQVTGDIVHMIDGKGGVGFLIYGKNHELLAFSDCYKFNISTRAQAAFAMGEARVYVANGDNSLLEVQVKDPQALQKDMLGALLKETQDVLDLTDATGTKVGFYYPESLIDLQQTKDEAQKIYDAGVDGTYAGAYALLLEAYDSVVNDDFSRVRIVSNGAYVLTNRMYPDIHMSIASNKALKGQKCTQVTDAEKWLFEEVGGITYLMKNKSTGTYLKDLEKDVPHVADAKNGEVSYKLVNKGNGYFALTCQNKDGQSLNYNPHLNNVILGWNSDDHASQWRLLAVEIPAEEAAKDELSALVRKTNCLIEECGSVKPLGNIALQVDHSDAPGYLSSNADQNTGGGQPDGGGVAALLDDDVNTYFHSRWGGSEVNEAHYLQIDLGAGAQLGDFRLTYATRKAVSEDKNSPTPTKITIMVSADGKNFTEIANLTKEADHLPSYAEMGKYWTSDVLKGNNNRYVRFVVLESEGPGNNMFGGKYFFGLSEIGLSYAGVDVKVKASLYEVTEELMVATYYAVHAANDQLDKAKSAEELQAATAELQKAYDALAAARDASLKYYQLTMTEHQYAGLYLDKNAMLPTGVTAYVVSRVNPTSVTLSPLEGDIVPAQTGLILKATEGVYRFDYTAAAASAKSLLEGSASTVFLKGEQDMSYYLFGVKNGNIGLYKAYLEYKADGSQDEGMNDTDKGGYFKVSANKVYLPEVAGSHASVLSFIFDEVTGVEGVETTVKRNVIYDLQGRRVNEIQQSGLYIVNGVKKFVKK